MKKYLFAILIATLIFSCEKEDNYSSTNNNVVSETEIINFEELLLLINIKTSDTTYAVVESIDSVKLFVNNSFWAQQSTEPMDTSKIESTTQNQLNITKTKVNYLLVAEQEKEINEFLTAGDYANYLNSINELQPGEYVCLIESFQIKFTDNTIKKYYPFTYKSFTIKENTKSAFVGEIELILN